MKMNEGFQRSIRKQAHKTKSLVNTQNYYHIEFEKKKRTYGFNCKEYINN